MNAVLIDGNSEDRERLKAMLSHHEGMYVTGEAGCGAEGMDLATVQQPGAVFMEVKLPDAEAFDLLPALAGKTQVVLMSTDSTQAARAFEYDVLDFLQKPLTPSRLSLTVDKLLGSTGRHHMGKSANRSALEERIILQTGRQSIHLQLGEIAAIQASGDYSIVRTRNGGEHMVLKRMQEWEETLPEDVFFRIHRSLIVNRYSIRQIESHSRNESEVTLDDGGNPLMLRRTALLRLRKILEELEHMKTGKGQE
jgi:two-component system LytT family response regulator